MNPPKSQNPPWKVSRYQRLLSVLPLHAEEGGLLEYFLNLWVSRMETVGARCLVLECPLSFPKSKMNVSSVFPWMAATGTMPNARIGFSPESNWVTSKLPLVSGSNVS